MRTVAALTLCTQVRPPNCICRRLDHSSNLSDTYTPNRRRPQFPFSHRKWIFDMITDAENCLGPGIQWCQHRAILLSPANGAATWANSITSRLIRIFDFYLWICFANNANITIVVVVVVGSRSECTLFRFLFQCSCVFSIAVAVAVQFWCTAECSIDSFGAFEIARRPLMCRLIDFAFWHNCFGTFGWRRNQWTPLNRFLCWI